MSPGGPEAGNLKCISSKSQRTMEMGCKSEILKGTEGPLSVCKTRFKMQIRSGRWLVISSEAAGRSVGGSGMVSNQEEGI